MTCSSIQATYQEGIIRGLVDVCLKTQAEDINNTGSSWLTDDYVKGLMYDTLAAGKNNDCNHRRFVFDSFLFASLYPRPSEIGSALKGKNVFSWGLFFT